MIRCCLACGRTENLETHHVGGRGYSPVTIDLCSGCHRYCTIAENYERQWFAGYPPLMVWAGVMDVLNLCGRSIGWNGISRAVSGYLRDAELSGVYVYRPASAVITVNGSLPSLADHRVTEIQRMTGEAIRVMTRIAPRLRTGEALRDSSATRTARRGGSPETGEDRRRRDRTGGSPDAGKLGAAGQRRDAEARTARQYQDQGDAETGATPEAGRLGEARTPETRATHG